MLTSTRAHGCYLWIIFFGFSFWTIPFQGNYEYTYGILFQGKDSFAKGISRSSDLDRHLCTASRTLSPFHPPFSHPMDSTSTPAAQPLHVNLSDTFGVVFWAFVVATVLFGVSVVQGYFYFMHNNDTRQLRIFVACMLVLDFATTALSSQSLHYYLVVNFGNPLALTKMTKPYIAEYALTAVVTLGSQLFYASRIHLANKQSRHYVIPFIICVMALVAFGLAVGATVEIFLIDRLITGLEGDAMRVLAGLNTSFAALCDIIATISMCKFLATGWQSPFKQTRNIIHFLLFFTINRGVFVAVAQLGFLTTYLAAPSKIYWMPFHLSISKLHVNTLLAMLNARHKLRQKTEISEIRLSQDCSFNTAIGRDMNRLSMPQPLKKGSLRLSAGPFELGRFPKPETSPTVVGSPSSKKYPDDTDSDMNDPIGDPMPQFNHDIDYSNEV